MRLIELVKVPHSVTSGGLISKKLTLAYRTASEAVATLTTQVSKSRIALTNSSLVGVARGKVTATERRTKSKAQVIHHNTRFVVEEPLVGLKSTPTGDAALNSQKQTTLSISISTPGNIAGDPVFVDHTAQQLGLLLREYADVIEKQDGFADAVVLGVI